MFPVSGMDSTPCFNGTFASLTRIVDLSSHTQKKSWRLRLWSIGVASGVYSGPCVQCFIYEMGLILLHAPGSSWGHL